GSDYLVDVFLGRLSADSVTDCNLIVAKTLGYGRTPYMSDTDWFKSGTLIVRDDYDPVDDPIYYGDTWFAYDLWENEGFVQIDTLFNRNGSDAADVHAAVTDGRVLVNYRGQGVSNWWFPFDVNPASTYPGYKLPVVVSATCGTGSFYQDNYPCETWMRAGTVASPKGAVAFVATSEITSGHADYRSVVDKGFYNAMFNLKMHTVGEALVKAKLDFYNIFGVQNEYEGWNVQGDPELDVWTMTPRYPDVTHSPTVPTNPSDLLVHVEYGGNNLQEVLVCAYAPGEVYEYGYTNAQGNVTLSISPADADTVWITATGHNLHPYEGHAVVTATGPYLVYADSFTDDSSTGNNDGVITPGETIELSVDLENVGPEDAVGVTGVLTSADTYVSLGDSTSSYGTIVSGGNGSNVVPFTFTPTADCPNGHELQLTLDAQDGSRTQWTINVPDVTVAAADLSHVSTLVGDASPGGDGDGVLEPGETAWLTLTLENGGPIDLDDVTGLLSTGSEYAAVTDPDGEFGDMAGGGGTAQSAADAFRVSVSPTAPPGYLLSLTLTADGDAETYQHSQDITFSITLGGDTATGPSGPDAYGYYAYDTGDGWTGQAPVYSWVELVGTGSQITAITNADAATTTLTLPFTFRYYGTDYTSISVCSNGFLALGTEDYRFGDNSGIPSTHGPDAMVAPFWDDLDPSAGGDVYQWYDSANHRWICQFDAVVHYGGGSAETFEVILLDPSYYPATTGDGQLIFQYQTIVNIYSATVGIENATQTTGIQYLYDATYAPSAAAITSGQAIKFTTEGPSAPPVWLAIAGSSVDDTVGGDGDGHAEPLERIDLIVTLDNLGTDAASDITGTLTTSDPDVSVDDGSASFGTIGAGLSGDNAASPFRITVGSGPSDELVELDLHLFTGGRYDTYDVLTLVLDLSQTGVEGEIPLTFALKQNSPNPFRDGTTMSFDLPSPSRAELTVYNVAGRKVATVVDGELPAGRHSVSWNGRDDEGREVSAGIYFYMLEADQGRSGRKLIVLR
ncbi:MAG: T9SS type A sorting domain-containing protein, partial [Candidatus Eisenbacteria bacterium]|nr:T9SS type A sorting domain-containing protein [Candidatus Eisenbacteria bacterium]